MIAATRQNFVAIEFRLTAAEAEALELVLPRLRQMVERVMGGLTADERAAAAAALEKLRETARLRMEPFEEPVSTSGTSPSRPGEPSSPRS